MSKSKNTVFLGGLKKPNNSQKPLPPSTSQPPPPPPPPPSFQEPIVKSKFLSPTKNVLVLWSIFMASHLILSHEPIRKKCIEFFKKKSQQEPQQEIEKKSFLVDFEREFRELETGNYPAIRAIEREYQLNKRATGSFHIAYSLIALGIFSPMIAIYSKHRGTGSALAPASASIPAGAVRQWIGTACNTLALVLGSQALVNQSRSGLLGQGSASDVRHRIEMQKIKLSIFDSLFAELNKKNHNNASIPQEKFRAQLKVERDRMEAIRFEEEEQYAVKGVQRITRHPAFTALSLWSVASIARSRGFRTIDVAFWGGMLAFSIAGTLHQDARQRRDGALGEEYFEKTSFVPFWAILQGKNQLKLDEFNHFVALGSLAVGLIFFRIGRNGKKI